MEHRDFTIVLQGSSRLSWNNEDRGPREKKKVLPNFTRESGGEQKAGSRDSGRGKAFCSAVCCVVHPALSFCSTTLSAWYRLWVLLVLLFSFSLPLYRSVHPCSKNLALLSFQAWSRLPKQKDSILLMHVSTASLSNIHVNVQLSFRATRDSVSICN